MQDYIMIKYIFLIAVFSILKFKCTIADSGICCDKIESLIKERVKASTTICGLGNNLPPGCCENMKKEVDSYIKSQRVLCPNTTSGTCDSPKPLGMESGKIPDKAITASSVHAPKYHEPSFARLNKKSGRCSWAPKFAEQVDSWLQVDFGKTTIITGVATQGTCYQYNEWTKSYSISYGNGKTWQTYQENGSKKVFQGNSDRTTVVTNYFSPPVKARYIRFLPITWNGAPVTRIEYYGCSLG